MPTPRYLSASAYGTIAKTPITSGNTSYWETVIDTAERRIDEKCQTDFVAESAVAKTIRGTGKPYLRLPKHCRSFTAVEILDSTGAVLETITDKVYLDPVNKRDNAGNILHTDLERDLLEDEEIIFDRSLRYRVTGNWGPSAVPSQIAMATARLATHMDNLARIDATVRDESVAGRTFSTNLRAEEIPEYICHMLSPWRIDSLV